MTSPGEGSLPQSTITYKGQRSQLDSCVISQAERVEEARLPVTTNDMHLSQICWREGGTPE